MPSILSFPSYSPDKQTLRSYLLFQDKISTIVPRVDQKKVMERPTIEEILTVSSGQAFGFYDPTYQYSEWFSQTLSRQQFTIL